MDNNARKMAAPRSKAKLIKQTMYIYMQWIGY